MNVALVRSASQAGVTGGLGATTTLPSAGRGASRAPDPVTRKREDQQRQRAIKVFEDHDTDHSGSIEMHELPAVAEYLGLPLEDGDAEAIMAELDKDKSGKLEKEEFIRWWLDRVLPPENYRRQQEVIARNVFFRSGGADDGVIDIGELEGLAADLGLPLSPEELAKAMERLDSNGDGKLQVDEFVSWWVEKSMNWEVDDELSKKLRKLAETAKRRLSTDIHTATWMDDVALVEEFLKADPALVDAEDSTEFGERYRPLHYAAYRGNLELCRLLVSNGAKVMAPTSTGCHAIFFAAQQNHPDVVKFLLDEGADPTMCETEAGMCAVDVAEYSKEALQVFKDFSRLSKPDKPGEAPELKLGRGESLELHFLDFHRTAPFQLPVQELKVKIMRHAGSEPPTMANLAIFPARQNPILLKGLRELTEYSVQVAYINGLGAGPYSEPSNVVKTGEARGGNNRSASASVAENNKENAGGEQSAEAEGQNEKRAGSRKAHSRSSSTSSAGSAMSGSAGHPRATGKPRPASSAASSGSSLGRARVGEKKTASAAADVMASSSTDLLERLAGQQEAAAAGGHSADVSSSAPLLAPLSTSGRAVAQQLSPMQPRRPLQPAAPSAPVGGRGSQQNPRTAALKNAGSAGGDVRGSAPAILPDDVSLGDDDI